MKNLKVSAALETPPDACTNVRASGAVQPKELNASKIPIRLGATWIPPEIVEQFVFQLFGTPRYAQWNIHVRFSRDSGEWNVEGKTYDRGNFKAYNTYGTDRINGYEIIEDTLNLKNVRIFDYVDDASGHRVAVLNKKETAIAQGKQELIKAAFAEWIWQDTDRRMQLYKLYSEKSTRAFDDAIVEEAESQNASPSASEALKEDDICRNAIKQYGITAQTYMAFEEMAELQQALCKNVRGADNISNIAEEIADVQIMLRQMSLYYGIENDIEKYRQEKLRRLQARLSANNI